MTKVIGSGDRIEGVPTVATIGMFDGVHLGHATLIAELRRQATLRGMGSAVITFERHPRHVLSPDCNLGMIMPLDERIGAISKHNPDYIVTLDFTRELAALSSARFMQMLHDRYGVTVLVMGYNHRFGHDTAMTFGQYVEQGARLGIEVVKAPEYLGEYAPVSSTIVRGLIAAGKVDDAARCMGHRYRLRGKVVHGYHNGRGIGFPTANIGEVDPMMILPHNGAYAVLIHIDNQRLKGMVNIGRRPTLDNGDELSIEVNIFDFDDDIYGKAIELEFVRFLRLEFKMGSVDELRQQLQRDRDRSLALMAAL